MNVHIDMDQSVQSEPRLRLLLAENLLRDTNVLIQRMEVWLYLTDLTTKPQHLMPMCIEQNPLP